MSFGRRRIGTLRTPPFYVSHDQTKENSVKQKCGPGSRACKIPADGLSFVTKEKQAEHLHHNREGTAGVKNTVDHKVADESALAFIRPIRRGCVHFRRNNFTSFAKGS